MSFGLKNIGAIYQRMVNKIFKHHIGRNIETYVNDTIVKSKIADSHLTNLAKTFQVLKKFNISLNQTMCF